MYIHTYVFMYILVYFLWVWRFCGDTHFRNASLSPLISLGFAFALASFAFRRSFSSAFGVPFSSFRFGSSYFSSESNASRVAIATLPPRSARCFFSVCTFWLQKEISKRKASSNNAENIFHLRPGKAPRRKWIDKLY